MRLFLFDLHRFSRRIDMPLSRSKLLIEAAIETSVGSYDNAQTDTVNLVGSHGTYLDTVGILIECVVH